MRRRNHNITVLVVMAVMAVVAAGCGADGQPGVTPDGQPGTPITLGATVEGTPTRAATPCTGSIDLSVLALADCGFGVFATSEATGWENWNNKKVTYDDPTPATNPGSVFGYPGSWTYEGGTRYWLKDANGGPITFYAYAPYDAAVTTSAIAYEMKTEPNQAVDLLWGVNSKTGLPWKNATLTGTTDDTTGGPVLFTFRHALAAIGLHVQAIVDKTNNTGDLTDRSDVASLLGESGRYKITVKKVTISGKFHPNATLSLDNTTANKPLWTDKTDAATSMLTVPREQIATAMQHTTDGTSTTAIGEGIMNNTALTGVTQEPEQPLIARNSQGAEQLFFVIPNTDETLTDDDKQYTVTVDWCISGTTLSGTYVAEDKESIATITGMTFDAGIKYYLNIVFNLKTIHLSVNAEDWSGTEIPVGITVEHGTSANSSLAPKHP